MIQLPPLLSILHRNSKGQEHTYPADRLVNTEFTAWGQSEHNPASSSPNYRRTQGFMRSGVAIGDQHFPQTRLQSWNVLDDPLILGLLKRALPPISGKRCANPVGVLD